MSQQSIFISDGASSGNNVGVTASNSAPTFGVQSLVAQYNSSAPTLTDGNLSFLQTDVNGNLKTTASVSFTYVANPGAALPAQTAWIGASDGTDLQGLLVESSSNANLRNAIYYGATEMIVESDGYTGVHQIGTWNVGVTGTVAVTQSTSPWVVSGTVTSNQGGAPWTVTGTYASNVAAGSDAVKGLIGRYQSSPTALTDGNLTYLQTDAYGKLLTTATLSPTFVAVPGTAVPADAAWIGASDGTNLQGLKVESSSNPNLRIGLYNGTTEASVTASNTAIGNGLQVLGAEFISTGAATGLSGPVDGYRFAGTQVTSGNATFAMTDGYGRLEMACARAIAYAYENRASQTVTLKNTAGTLRKVIVGNAGNAGALVTFYDNTAASGTVIAVLNTSNVLGQIEFDIPFAVGLTYTTNNKSPGDVTLTFE